MATVTGTLQDFGLQSLNPYKPRLYFTPSGPGLKGSNIVMATRPVTCTPDIYGLFTVNLSSNEDVQPATWYELAIRWLDSEGNFISVDYVPWKLFVPNGGGAIGDLFDHPINNALIWVGPTAPPITEEPGNWWIKTDTGDIMKAS